MTLLGEPVGADEALRLGTRIAILKDGEKLGRTDGKGVGSAN